MTRNITAVLLIALLVTALAGILVAQDTGKPAPKEKTTYLSDMKTVKGLGNPTWPYSYSREKLGGVDVDHCLKPYESSQVKNGGEWKLGGKYDRLECLIGIADNDNLGKSAAFEIIGDGMSLFKSDVIAPGDKPRPVIVDLKGVMSLTLKITDRTKPPSDWVSPSAVWGDVKLVRVVSKASAEKTPSPGATPGGSATPAEKKPLKITILVNGTYFGIPCKLSEGRLYVPLFELDKPLEGTFKWDPATHQILIKTTAGKAPSEKPQVKTEETAPQKPGTKTEKPTTGSTGTPAPQPAK